MKKIIIFIILVGVLVAGYFVFTGNKQAGVVSLSQDRKSIIADDELISVDNQTIFDWFKTESQLCDEANLDRTPDTRKFCQDKAYFKSQTGFAYIVVSPDNTKIGFAIESDILSPDKVVGIFSRTENKVALLTSYYLGNGFLGFSPSGTNFIYRGSCFEGMCGLFIKNSASLELKASLNNSGALDAREHSTTFVRWISDNEVEYKLGTETKRISF